MPWIILVLASVLLFSLASVLQRVLMKDKHQDAYASSILFQLLGAVVLGVVAHTQGFVWPPLSQYPIHFLLLAGLYGAGTLCLFNAYKYLEASEITIITSVRAIITIVSAVLILGEVFNILNGIGVFLIFISVFMVTQKQGKFKLNRGYLYALGMTVCYGLALTNDTFLLKHANVYSFAAIGSLLPGLFLMIVNPKKIAELKIFAEPKTFIKILVLVVAQTSAGLLFYLALSQGATASQATPILQVSVIVTVLLAAVFLGETERLVKKLVAAVLVSVGVILLT